MKTFEDAHVVAILWLIVAVMFVGWLAGQVSLALNEQDWSRMETPRCVTHKCVSKSCHGVGRGAWCL